MTKPFETTGWCVISDDPDRPPVVCTDEDVNEDGVWDIALGWPSDYELAAAKSRGARAFRVRVVEIMEGRQ